MLEGVLIAESLRVGTELGGVPLHITKIARVEVNNTAAEQPQQWTLLDFAAEEADAERLAEQLAASLAPTGGWYVNYNTTAEAFVVFDSVNLEIDRNDQTVMRGKFKIAKWFAPAQKRK